MAYTRRGNVRLQHRDSKSLIRKGGTGSGGGRKRTAKANIRPKSKRELSPASSVRGPGIIEAHTDDLEEN